MPASKEDWQVLLYFVALLAVRGPAVLENLNNFTDKLGRRLLDVASATPERWQSTLESRRAAQRSREDLSFGDVRRIIEERSVRFSMSKDWQVAQVFRNADTISPLLAQRTWSLLLSEAPVLIRRR